jgi:hypothetical protein
MSDHEYSSDGEIFGFWSRCGHSGNSLISKAVGIGFDPFGCPDICFMKKSTPVSSAFPSPSFSISEVRASLSFPF